jgi:hypothetical protein
MGARVCYTAVVVLATLVGITVAGCRGNERAANAPDFFPLHTDDTWVYEVHHVLRNERTRMTVRVRDERYVEALGRRCRMVEETYATEASLFSIQRPLTRPHSELYPVAYYHQEGYLFRSLSLEYRDNDIRPVGIGTTVERFLPDGLRTNLSWADESTAFDFGGGKGYAVRQTHWSRIEDEPVQVPAGAFHGCVRVDTVAVHGEKGEGADSGDRVVLYYSDWYAPNVGLIRSVQHNRPGGGPPTAQVELLSFDVAGAKQ